MSKVETLTRLNLDQIETLVFAAGGNRCWWQAGVLSHLLQEGWSLPKQLVGTSAGAAIATSCITDGPKAALVSCLALFSTNERIFDWSSLTRFKLRFAHQQIYPAWVKSFLNAGNFAVMLRSQTRLRVALTRPARLLGLGGSIIVGTLAYIIDKHLWHNIHPYLPKLLGLRQDFLDLHCCNTVEEAQALIIASAAAPPFMRSIRIGEGLAVDGGYTDNAPIHQQTNEEKSRTLILLTRHYPQLPRLFRWHQRVYWQPSQRVPVSTWDCTVRATIREAFAHGEHDAMLSFRGGALYGA